MRVINEELITQEVCRLCIEATHFLDNKTMDKLKTACNNETGLPKIILEQIIENDIIAKDEMIPMCQDTGIVVCFVEIGNNVHINGDIEKAINLGVKKAYEEAYLRKSVVKCPINRINTKDNTPAIIHYKMVCGDRLKITIAPKGAGSENMSKLTILNPADGISGIKKFVLDCVTSAGGRCCPPIILGIGIGGNMEKAALMSKEALMRPIDDSSNDPTIKNLEDEILELVNNSNVGPMGLGGKTTALSVKINTYPCHIASLPVAVNIQCHANRHKEVIL